MNIQDLTDPTKRYQTKPYEVNPIYLPVIAGIASFAVVLLLRKKRIKRKKVK